MFPYSNRAMICPNREWGYSFDPARKNLYNGSSEPIENKQVI
jgi:hypothetical protein